MEKLLTDINFTDSYDSFNDNLHSSSELNSTLNKCQSLINLQRQMIRRANPESNMIDKEKMKNLEKKYELDIDITKKENAEVINHRMKKFFNMNNYEGHIKKVAWKKDLSKIYLGLGDDKDNKDLEFEEYNFKKREKKKERLMFLRNFFGQLKSVKVEKKKLDKSKENLIYLNKYEKNYYHSKDKSNDIKIKINEKDLDLIVDRLKLKYSPEKINNESKNREIILNNNYNNLTEINNNSSIFNEKNKKNIYKIQNLFNSKYHLTELSKKFIKENYKNNIVNSNRYLFPKIKYSHKSEKKKSNTLMAENRVNRNQIKNMKINVSDKNIFNKNKIQFRLGKGFNRNKTYLEQLKNIYKSRSKKKIRIINNKSNNYEMPELLTYKEKPLFKKNNQLFFSPLHYSKYEQMKEIRDRLTGITGLMDKEVFTVYNKNI